MTYSTLLGVRIGKASLDELVGQARASIHLRQKPYVFACANPHSLVVARADDLFRSALNGADAVVADGVGCQWGAAIAGVSIGPRITGSDFFRAVMDDLNSRGGRAFFFGSSDSVLAVLLDRCRREFPRVEFGSLSPPYRPWSTGENTAMISSIHAFAPDVLWVGMTAPKQEKWVHENAQELRVPVIASIGAVFDYFAGLTPRAPQWVCDIGLEWLYRLPGEPKRLWRRTFVSGPLFAWYLIRDRLGI